MARLLVTGASGYLGAEVVRRAQAAGWEVVGTYLEHEPALAAAVLGPGRSPTWEHLDVRDAGAVDRLVDEHVPDAVIHTAYRQSGEGAEEITTAGAVRVAAAARRCGARLVHLSTDCVFGGGRAPLDPPLSEADPVAPVNDYGRWKAAAEAGVAAADPSAVLVRTSLIYGGPDAPPSRYEVQAQAAARGKAEVTFFTDERRSPIQVGDLAAALLELAAVRIPGPLHVAGAEAVDRLELARLMAAAAGHDPAGLVGAPGPPGRPGNCVLDSSRARSLLRTRLRGVREVLARG